MVKRCYKVIESCYKVTASASVLALFKSHTVTCPALLCASLEIATLVQVDDLLVHVIRPLACLLPI